MSEIHMLLKGFQQRFHKWALDGESGAHHLNSNQLSRQQISCPIDCKQPTFSNSPNYVEACAYGCANHFLRPSPK